MKRKYISISNDQLDKDSPPSPPPEKKPKKKVVEPYSVRQDLLSLLDTIPEEHELFGEMEVCIWV
jgi:hypothetical protein